MIGLSAPAKLNLTLEVLGKRTDGYHEIRSVIQTISLEDSLSFRASDEFGFHSDSPGWDAARSLVVKVFRCMTSSFFIGLVCRGERRK